MLFIRSNKNIVATALVAATVVLLGAPLTEAVFAPDDAPVAVDLGTAKEFAILSGFTVTVGAAASVTGDVGVSPIPSTSLVGFALVADSSKTYSTSTLVNGNVYAADMGPPTPDMLSQAVVDMKNAYTDGYSRTDRKENSDAAGTLAGRVLTSGVYRWGGAVTIPTKVTFDGSATDVWIIQVGGALSLAAAANVELVNGAKAENIFWVVFGAITVGAAAHVEGVFLCKAAITVAAASSLTGFALAQAGVTLGANAVLVRPEPTEESCAVGEAPCVRPPED